MSEKIKKQHYVPRCYLKRWENRKKQIYVFDKVKKEIRPSNINDIASERYFYDIDIEKMDAKSIEMLISANIDIINEQQFIEKFLSKNIEDEYSKLLAKIIDTSNEATPWYLENCYFISKEDKLYLAIYLSFQYVRTKTVREGIGDSGNCLCQVLEDMGVPQEQISKYVLDHESIKEIHGNMLFDFDNIMELAKSFYNLVWILGMNRTDKLFYSSDNPICTKAHIEHPFLSFSGIASKGVEVAFPLSPRRILIMYDGEYHKDMLDFERKYVTNIQIENVEYYNSLCAYQSERCIFSSDGDFALLENMLKDNSNTFDIPKTEMSWGGKKYYPRKD